MKIKALFKKNDLIIIFAVLLVTLLLFLFSKDGGDTWAQITVDGESLYELNLSQTYNTYSISLDNGVVIELSHNCIYFLDSDCSGKDCINCGKLSAPGDIAVCIPNKTVIKLTGKNNKSPDSLTY